FPGSRPGRRGTDTMHTSSRVVDKARELAAAGRHLEVVKYLGGRAGSELAESPSLALLYGTAQARLGRHAEGLRWLDVALDQARKLDEQAVEGHALNARGAVALVSGRIDEAADYFTQALMAASRVGDDAAVGRGSACRPARRSWRAATWTGCAKSVAKIPTPSERRRISESRHRCWRPRARRRRPWGRCGR